MSHFFFKVHNLIQYKNITNKSFIPYDKNDNYDLIPIGKL